MQVERNDGIVLSEEHIDTYVAECITELANTAYRCWSCWDELSAWTDWMEEETGEYQEYRIDFPSHNQPCERHGGVDLW